MTGPSAVLDELSWRGLVHQHTDGLPVALAKQSVSAYCGFDPTASSIHVGSLIPVMGLMHLQRGGHRPFVVVGGGTGLIGDPSGKTAERQLNSTETVEANARSLRGQLEHFLDFSGPYAAQMRNNADWLVPLRAVDFMRDVGKHFTVNYMLAKESVQARIESGISYTEFSYMLLQAYDYRELFLRDGVTLQVGGSDQWGNITAGMELIRRTEGGKFGRRKRAMSGSILSVRRPISSTSSGSTWTTETWAGISAISPCCRARRSSRSNRRLRNIPRAVARNRRWRRRSQPAYTVRKQLAWREMFPACCSRRGIHALSRSRGWLL